MGELDWDLFMELDFPVAIYKHSCASPINFSVNGRQMLGDGSWLQHNHHGQTAGEAIRKAHLLWEHGKSMSVTRRCRGRGGERDG